jgi:ABC-type branched-subunit amino acid transport system substrate-binding protein
MSTTRRRIVVAGLVILLAIVLLVGTGIIPTKSLAFLKRNKNPIYIALVMPKNDQSDASVKPNKEMELSIQLYLDKVNAEGGVNGHPVNYLLYDETDANAAEQSAEAIAKDGKTLVVIGNTYSDSALAAGPVYQQNEVPAITNSASNPDITKNNEWFFSMINNNEIMGKYAAGYVARLLGSQKATVIFEKGAYGESLGQSFLKWFTSLGGNVVSSASLSSSDTEDKIVSDSRNILYGIDSLQDRDPGIIFLALNDIAARNFIITMHSLGKNYPLIGAEDLSDNDFASQFAALRLPKELNQPGYYTEGMYSLPPVIYDVAGQKGQEFRNQYNQAMASYVSDIYGKTSAPQLTWFGGLSYDSALIAIEAMKKANISGDPAQLQADRKKIRDSLAGFNSYSTGTDGASGHIYFNTDRVFERPVSLGKYQHGQLISAPTQLQPISDVTGIPNIDQEISSGNIITIGDEKLYKTRVVYVGMDINEFSQIDVDNAHKYSVDFYVWFRYQGDSSAENIEFTNAASAIDLSTPINPLDLQDPFGDIHYRAYRVSADFSGNFNLRDYPFDQQSLQIQFRNKGLQRTRLIYVLDYLGMGDVTNQAILGRLKEKALERVPDWRLSDASLYIDDVQDKSTLGNPALFGKTSNIEYSRFNAVVDIKRDVIRFLTKTMFPVFFLIILAYLGLFLPADEFGTISGIMTGTVLSIVFFHVDLSNRLNVGYSVALDYYFYIIYALLVLELLISIIAWHRSEDKTLLRRMFIIMRVIYPVVLIGAGIIFALVYKVI